MAASKTLKARIANAAKSYDDWQLVTSKPKLGEICLEYHSESIGDGHPYYYKVKIGDNVSTYSELPYFGDLTALTGSCDVVRWNTTGSYLEYYRINQANGRLYLADEPYLKVRTSGSNLAMTGTTTGGVTTVELAHTGTSPAATSSVQLDFSSSFEVPAGYDEHGHVIKTRTFRLPTSASIDAVSNSVAAVSTSLGQISSSVSSSLSSLSGSIATVSGTLGRVSSSVVSLSSSLDQISGTVTEHWAEFGLVSQSYYQFSGSASVQLNNLSSSLTAVSGTVVTLSGSVGTLSSSLATVSGTLGQVSSSVVTLSSSFRSFSSSVSSSLATIEDELVDQAADIDHISGTVVSMSGILNTVTGSVHSLEAFSGSINSFTSSINSYTSSINSFTSSINTFTGSVSSSVAGLSSSVHSLEVHSGSVNTFTGSVNSFTSSINTFTGSINTFTGSISSSFAAVSSSWEQFSSSYKNPVKGTTGDISGVTDKLPIYDSSNSVKSSIYTANTSASVFETDGKTYTLPTVQQVINYVGSVVASSLIYKGTISVESDLPGSPEVGWMYVASSTIIADGTGPLPAGTYQAGDFFIWNGTSWGVIQGTVAVTNEDATITSSSTVLATVEGREITAKIPAYNTIAPIQSIGSTDTGSGGLEVVGIGSTGRDIRHKTVVTGSTEHQIDSDSEGVPGVEGTVDLVTNISVDSYGHVTGKETIKSDKLIAADIKAPVTESDDSTWNFRETGGDISVGEDTAKIPSLKGNTIVWNQTVPIPTNDMSVSSEHCTITDNRNGSYTIVSDGSNTVVDTGVLFELPDTMIGHRVLFLFGGSPTTYCFRATNSDNVGPSNSGFVSQNSIFTLQGIHGSGDSFKFKLRVLSNTTISKTFGVNVFDLTKMFGSDDQIAAALGVPNLTDSTNLTKAAENFEKLFPNSYYPYCEGRLVSLGGYKIKWNQIFNTDENPTFTITAGSSYPKIAASNSEYKIYENHKYYTLWKIVATSGTIPANMYFTWKQTGDYRITPNVPKIFVSSEGGTYAAGMGTARAYTSSASACTGTCNIMLIDLTEMFGPGSEPTLEEFEAMFTKDYYEYDAGTEMNIFDAIGDKKLGLISTGDIPDESEPHAVDMGLPSGLLWADSNIDITQEDGFAASPYQYGCTMFSWGNVDGYNTPATGTTFDHNWGGINSQEPWYDGQPYGNTTGNSLTADIVTHNVSQDAAYRNVGAPWHMPSSAEFKELTDNCDFIDANGNIITGTNKLTTVSGAVGIYLRSKINGNRLFFACSGYGNGSLWGAYGVFGLYWASSFYSSRYARALYFRDSGIYPQELFQRYSGYAIRAVRQKKQTLDLDWIRNEGVENFNIWDEEWELGAYEQSTGYKSDSSTRIRSKNQIPVFASAMYKLTCKQKPLTSFVVIFYDTNKNYISSTLVDNNIFTIPSNGGYITFCTATAYYGTIYLNDICINISNPALNGEYYPYGAKAKYFPQGLLSAGSICDEAQEGKLIKKIWSTDLGDLTWINDSRVGICAALPLNLYPNGSIKYNDNGGFVNSKYNNYEGYYASCTLANLSNNMVGIYTSGSTVSVVVNDSNITSADINEQGKIGKLTGVKFHFRLPQSVEIPLAETHRMGYVVADHGTEQQLPVNVSSVINAPFRGTFEYYSNFKDAALDVIANWGDKTPSEEPLEAGKSYYNDTVPTSKATWTAVAKRNVAAAPVSTLPEVNNYPAIIIRNAAFTDAPQFTGQFYVQIGVGAWIGIGTSTTADWKPITA